MAIPATFLAVLSLVAAWTALGTGLAVIRLAAFVCAIPALAWGFAKSAPRGPVAEAIEIFEAIGVPLAGSLLVLRLFGFRLVRITRTGPPAQVGSPTP